jgi:hypothetical protein
MIDQSEKKGARFQPTRKRYAKDPAARTAEFKSK